MSYVSPKMRPRFETLSVDLKNEILRRDVRIETLHDLIAVLGTDCAGWGNCSLTGVLSPLAEIARPSSKTGHNKSLRQTGRLTEGFVMPMDLPIP